MREPDDDLVDKGRDAWTSKRRLYDPETGRRTKPERDSLPSSDKAKREKANRYRSQRKMLKKLERDAELERLSAIVKKDIDRNDPYAYEDDDEDIQPPRQSDLGPYESIQNDYYYSPESGFTWNSKDAYKRYHTPGNYKVLREYQSVATVAVYNIKNGEIFVDAVAHPVFIVEMLGWDCDDTITIERHGGDLVITSELDESVVKRHLDYIDLSMIGTVLSE